LFFSSYLADKIEAPIWPPAVKTIKEFISGLSNLESADRLSLIFQLFEEFKKVIKSENSFDEFYYWGEILLNDFDNIDKYLIPADDLFHNLKSMKDIESKFSYLDEEQVKIIKEFWMNFNPVKPGIYKQNFIDIWTGLSKIYSSYRQKLLSTGQVYEGLIFREVVNILENDKKLNTNHSHYYFVGFNALNKCEEYIFNHFKKNKKASFIWDYDKYYLDNKFHEAGFFLRNNLKNFPPVSFGKENKLFDNFNHKERELNIWSVPSDLSQAKITNFVLESIPSLLDDKPDKTAIVLPDESLLMPVLSSIPEKIKNINITMGYPIKDTSVYSFIEFIVNLFKSIKENKSGHTLYYHRDVLSLINHQYIISLAHNDSRKIENHIIRSNSIYIPEESFKDNPLVSMIFNNKNARDNFPEYLMNILFYILEADDDNEQKTSGSISFIDKEFIYKVYLTVKRISVIIEEHKSEFGFKVLIKVLLKAVAALRIPFEGEPLKGLQIMGLLETRLLDFDNVVILSVNEGVLPGRKVDSSYIPHNIRRAFGLPVNENFDAIYAYYFYRLIQRSKNVYLLYNSLVNDKGVSTGEPSRYISQLEAESEFIIKRKNISFDLSMTLPSRISVSKDGFVLQRLERYKSDSGFSDYLSPSALNTYLDCSLKFYFRYIAGIKESEEVSEEVDALLFGSIIHKSLEIIYKDYVGGIIAEKNIEALLKDKKTVEDAVKRAFMKVYHKNDSGNLTEPSGKNSLIYDIIINYSRNVLKYDKMHSPFKIVGLERKLFSKRNFQHDGFNHNIDIGGTIDRIDFINDSFRIIDYKTGKPSYSAPDIPSLFKKDSNNRNSTIFQILVYSEIFKESLNREQSICPSVFYVKDINQAGFDWHIKINKELISDYNTLSEEFNENLNDLISEIFNKNLPFNQTTEEKNCGFCSYTEICNRKKADNQF